jgi:poly(hydroxyalkanoate) depolymerase family esterase
VHGFLGVAAAPPWREYLLYLPRGMEAARRRSLLVWIHGCRQDPEAFAGGTRIREFADRHGFVVLLPRQSRLANAERCWNWFDRRTARGAGEAAIVAAQAAEVIAKHGIDPRRVYVAGLSSGAGLAAALALHQPGLFAAAAFHSGLPAGAASDAHEAAQVMARGPRGAVADEVALQARAAAGAKARLPVLVIQGLADEAVAPVNAAHLARQFLLFNGMPPGELPPAPALPPSATSAAQPHSAVTSEYYAGRRLAVRLVTVPGLGHAWSGGDAAFPYSDARHLDATALVCDFFASRP